MTLIAAALGGLLAVAATARGTGAGTPAPAAFKLADGSAGCAFDGNRLACRAEGATSAVVLAADGRSEAADVDVRWDSSTSVLHRAERWFHGAFACGVDDGDTIRCSASHGSLSVARAGVGAASSAAYTAP